MKRPLALFGILFFIATLAAIRLPVWLLFVLALAFALLFGAALWLRRARLWPAHIPLALAAAACAFVLCGGYQLLQVAPLQHLQGQQRQVTARVTAVQPAYGEDTVHATLQLLSVEGEQLYSTPQVLVGSIPTVQLGDIVSLPLQFHAFSTTGLRNANYSKGFYIGATAADVPVVTGTSHTFLTQMRSLQYAAGSNIMGRLPSRLASVAAAMSVGDKRFLSAATVEAYRMAGLSHMLVVSGLHLSILCTYLFISLRAVLRRRRLAAIGCIVFVVLFMAFTGLTPSVVRSGFVYLLLYAALLFRRKADVFTSMGLAAVVLLIANPFACIDVGLLLSFTATFGALASGQLAQRWRSRAQANSLPRRVLRRLGLAALTPLCVTVATLPVLVWAGLGTSLLSLPMNILAVPLLTPIVLCGLLMALPALAVLAAPASLIGGALLAFLQWLTGLCASAGWAWVPLGGLFGFVAVLAVYALAGAAIFFRRPLPYLPAAAMLILISLALGMALSAGTVQVHVATGGANASLVVVSGRQAVVLYRGRQTASSVSRILRQSGAAECTLFIDLRQSSEGTEYTALFHPQQLVIANEDVISRAQYRPLQNVTVSLARQGSGTVACVEVGGYRIGLASGSVSLEPYAPLDVLLSGSGAVSGEYATLLATGKVPAWANPGAGLIHSDGAAMLWLRPGTSFIWKEVSDGISDG